MKLVLIASVAGAMALQSAVDADNPIVDPYHPEMRALAERITARRGLSGNTLSAQDKKDILQLHNKVRADTARGEYKCKYGPCGMAANMQKLQWSDALADVANEWSAKCKFGHRQNSKNKADHCQQALTDRKDSIDFKGYYAGASCGENLAASGLGPTWSAFVTNSATGRKEDFGMAGMIENGWSKNEAALWDKPGNGWAFDHQTGHYTQVVWAATRYVGCGISYCSGKTGADPSWMRALLTCNYYPPGNYKGQDGTSPNDQPYKPGKACSNCDDGQKCTDGETYSTQSAAAPAPTTYDLSGLCTGASDTGSSSTGSSSTGSSTGSSSTGSSSTGSSSTGGKTQAQHGISREKRCAGDLGAYPKQYTLNGFPAFPQYRIDMNGPYTWSKCDNGGSVYYNGANELKFDPLHKYGDWVMRCPMTYLGFYRGTSPINAKPASAKWKVIGIQNGGVSFVSAAANALVCEGANNQC